MRRRDFLATGLAAAAFPIGAIAAPFASGRLSVITRGSGPDVILIPGLTSPRDIWSGLVAAVPGYRYHLVQVAGFAGDAPGANATGPVLEPLAADIARYIRTEHLRSPAIVGHSMGGTLGMMLASRHPDLVGRLMVVDILPAPAGMFGATASTIRPFADTLLDALTSTPGGQQLLQSFIGGGSAARAASDPNLVARATHELAVTDLTDDLAGIRAPITVVYATAPAGNGSDPMATTRSYRAAYANAPGAKLIRIANSGHMIMADQPGQFASAVRDFLKG